MIAWCRLPCCTYCWSALV
ncbi:hypothetical protein E2C01_058246 [Portunus trituberculatus]|uniref:Uncharacterized protein n=1 Tax=Portunus trituberculatus TaxID=210409 RepID=A0A5B7H5J5_PORTR|nr:hypothetical protein [Portunus trituberculatus]